MATSLEIPQTFLNDIQSRNPQIIPLIHIELEEETLKFSTVPLSVTGQRPYHPLLLNIPRVSQSVDFFSKKFKPYKIGFVSSDKKRLYLKETLRW